MDDYETDWTMISFETPKKAEVEQSAPVLKGVCPKCQKIIGRGLHFHIKACVGK